MSPALPSTLPATPVPGAPAPAEATASDGKAPVAGSFAAFLAIGADALAAPADKDAPAMLAAKAAAIRQPGLPETGKSLPSDLPQGEGATDTAQSSELAEAGEDSDHALPAGDATVPAQAFWPAALPLRASGFAASSGEAPQPLASNRRPAGAQPLAAVSPRSMPAPTPAGDPPAPAATFLTLPPEPATIEPASRPAARGPVPTSAVIALRQDLGQPAAAAIAPASDDPRQTDGAPLSPLPAAPSQRGGRDAAIAAVSAPEAQAPQLSDARMLADQPAAAIAVGTSAPAPAPSAAPATPQTRADTGPQDFATLIDRLVEARDAAMPQAVRAAIAHAEFGQVSLRFHQQDGDIAVSMTSADPGFAPAVQAAVAASQPASGSANDTGRNDGSRDPRQEAASSQQQAAQANAGQSGGGQQAGQPRAAERMLASASGKPDDPNPTADDSRADRGGIYA